MKEEIHIYQLQYLINETGIIGNYIIESVEGINYERGSSFKTEWNTNAKGNIVEFVSDIEWNDENPPQTKKVLKFKYRTEYKIHHQLIDLSQNITNESIWNISELLFRHKCIIQQLFIERNEFIENNFPHSTESFYHSYQEVKQRIR